MILYSALVFLAMVAVGMLGRTRRFRWVTIGIAIAGIIGASAEVLPILRANWSLDTTDYTPLFDALRATYTFRALATLSMPFAEMAVQGFDRQWAINFGLMALVSVVLLVVTLRIDRNYYEESFRASERRAARLEKYRRGRISRGAWSGAKRVRLRMLPRFGGAGPTMHRHLLTMMRDSTTLWLCSIVIFVSLAAGLYFRFTTEGSDVPIKVGLAVTLYTAFIITNIVRFDFRSDYTVLDYLKVLPIRPFALAAGTLTVPSLFAFLVQTVPPGVFAAASGGPYPFSPVWLTCIVPCNVIWFALNNAFYLRAPTPMVRGLQSNPTAAGHQFLAMLGIGLTMGVIGLCAAGVYFLARVLSENAWVAVIAAAAFLWPCAGGAVFLTGRAFAELDLGRDRL
jgi:hypothetical protein